ncbi:hypothetical protein C1H46_020543 [Malus baccata]|uniref:Pentacotripeptide-repeat region of PRORP domain-containing protein n=1 Tax=Malus baccata TaxID=106549 RepID=A0A540M552_MALBA|nr:hypothetical protein C1H46_020543 [Malus baccata]
MRSKSRIPWSKIATFEFYKAKQDRKDKNKPILVCKQPETKPSTRLSAPLAKHTGEQNTENPDEKNPTETSPFSLSSRILPPRPPRQYKNGGSSSEASNSYSASSFSSNPRWVFTNSLPPPEWVEPFNDVSDVVSNRQNFEPFPWVAQILNLLDGSPTMEANLDSYCRTFLIKLSPNFVSYVLKSVELRGKLETALRSFLGQNEGECGSIEEAMKHFERMKNEGLEPDEVTYGVIVNGLCKSGRVEEAMEYFEFCEGRGMTLNAMFYSVKSMVLERQGGLMRLKGSLIRWW